MCAFLLLKIMLHSLPLYKHISIYLMLYLFVYLSYCLQSSATAIIMLQIKQYQILMAYNHNHRLISFVCFHHSPMTNSHWMHILLMVYHSSTKRHAKPNTHSWSLLYIMPTVIPVAKIGHTIKLRPCGSGIYFRYTSGRHDNGTRQGSEKLGTII